MLIVSKFHDYYDSAAIYGIDKTCIFNRDQISHVTKTPELDWVTRQNGEVTAFKRGVRTVHKDQIYRGLIGFCGELYPFVKIVNDQTRFFYNKEAFENYSNYKDLKLSGWFGTSESEFWNPKTWESIKKLFRDLHAPYFVIDKPGELVQFPVLKEYNFMSVKPPAIAFQEVYMYLSGVLGNTENDTIEIDDKSKLHKKGFDNWSFKKKPTKRKG